MAISIQVNGETKKVEPNTTVGELLGQIGISDLPVAVEINRRVVPRKLHQSETLRDGDKIEIVTFVGGG